MITCDEGSGYGAATPDVDRKVEPEVDTLNREGGIAQDDLPRWEDLLVKLTLILLGYHGRHVCFDRTGTEAHDRDGQRKEAEGGLGML